MANRFQNDQWGRGRGEFNRNNPQRSRDEDDNRYSRSEGERDYGSYTDNDEGDSAVRAGSYDQGRTQFGRGNQDRHQERGGSSERYAGYGNFGQGDYGGQGGSRQQEGRYAGGQGDYRGGNQDESNYGYGRGGRQQFPRYGREGGSSGTSMYGRSAGQGNEPRGEEQRYSSSGQSQSGSGSQSGSFGERMGEHHGKGPKGYQRSDERIKELICERLHDDPQIDPSEVTINVQGGKVTLEGTVDSRQTKNAIEDVAEQFGVQDVQNNLRVQRTSQAGEAGGRSMGKTGAEERDRGGRQNRH